MALKLIGLSYLLSSKNFHYLSIKLAVGTYGTFAIMLSSNFFSSTYIYILCKYKGTNINVMCICTYTTKTKYSDTCTVEKYVWIYISDVYICFCM